MNCQEALNLLYDIIDKEASEIDTKEVQRHLEKCHDCFQKYHLEGSVQALLQERLKVSFDVPRVDHLKSKVLTELDRIDEHLQATGQKRFPFRFPSLALASVASLILLVGAAFFAADLYRHYLEYIPLERAHWGAKKDMKLLNNSADTEVVMASVNSSYGFSMEPEHDGLSLVGGHFEEIDGMNVAHFVYSDGNHAVSVFVIPGDEIRLASDLVKTKVEVDGHCYYDHHCRGCRLVYHEESGAVIVTASTDHNFDLLRFHPATNTI